MVLTAALDARGITKNFPGVRALAGVDITIYNGRVHALLGENGAGKSTLVKIFTGLQQPDSGTLHLAGELVSFPSPRDAIEHGVTPVYQELTIMPEMSVLDNVMLGHETARRGVLSGAEQRKQASRALQRVALGDLDLRTLAGDLSLGNKQLLEIARALVRRSKVLILDEPSAVLSGDKLEALHSVVRSLATDGTAVVYITHLLDEVHMLANDVTILRDGTLVSTGPVGDYTNARIVRDMVGRQVDSIFPGLPVAGAETVLKAEGLVPRGSGARPFDLELKRGEIVGIAGLVGSGRSRLLRTLAGIRAREAGSVTVDGQKLPASLRRSIRAGVVLVPEERKRDGIILDLPVSQNMSLTALRAVSRNGWIRPAAEVEVFEEEKNRLQIRASRPGQRAGQLSGGNQQKVVLAKWLRVKPKVLLLDEPTRGVDVGAKSEIYDIITALAASGMTILVASSELNEVIGLSHRVIVCRGGNVVGEVRRTSESPEEIMHLAMGSAS